MIDRSTYVDKIMAYTDTPFVKVLTGVRRCGKSTILKMIMKKLQEERSIPENRIISIRFDSMEYEDTTAKEMYRIIKEKLVPDGKSYLFLDEVQEIKGWEKAYLLHRCSRYDLRGKEILKTQEKFYLADTSLRYSVLGYTQDSVAASLENVVYLELCRRGYTVSIGKTLDGEIDFVAQRQNDRLYIHVTQEIKSEKTEKKSMKDYWKCGIIIPNMC